MDKERIYKIINGAIWSEKSSNLRTENQYMFDVALDSKKFEIKEAVEALWNVNVVSVNTSLLKGKVKNFGRRRGKQNDTKRAIVRLKDGQVISELLGGEA